ncbi:hypothetical protein CJA_2509 [Cellvibrio japonicus Ueda107]|uniref:Uncharacterized protein n=2 Tax=Cellvibrio japonicus TaxID=155077 RepID=B3PKZ6_CELJU|nr:hypothetical protein CJA_2509 [Cellvibrio japonicus Ueda107]
MCHTRCDNVHTLCTGPFLHSHYSLSQPLLCRLMQNTKTELIGILSPMAFDFLAILLRAVRISFVPILLLWSMAAVTGEALKHGAVMARAMVLDSQGKPILVEYNEDGEEVSVVSWSGEFKDLSIISAQEYRMEKARYDIYKESRKHDLAMDAEIVPVEEFTQTEYKAADGKTTIIKPPLKSYVKSVLVRGQSHRIVPSGHKGAWEPLVLLSFSVDLSQDVPAIPEKGTLLLNDKGQVVHSTENNIAPRVGFFGDANEPQEFYSGIRKHDDHIFGPVKHVKVYINPEVFPGSLALTDSQGKYIMRFHLPICPGGVNYTTDVWAELYYANFSPYGAPLLPYYLRRQDSTFCYDPLPVGGFLGLTAYVNASGLAGSLSTYFYNVDLKVDVMFLSGRIFLRNPDGSAISVGNTTEYHVTAAATDRTAQTFYDFDGDGKYDTSEVGDIEDQPQPDGSIKKVFVAKANGQYQGVYFSSLPKVQGQPNAVRLSDRAADPAPNGLLKSISKEDLKNTDILVFRESTGQLILERSGLKDEEISSRVDIGLGEDDKYFYYRLMLRGPADYDLNIGAINRHKNWADWAEEYRLAEPLRKREADHPKSGEWVRLVVINRATGYMGTQRVQLMDASKNIMGMLNVKLEDTFLQPPNLKIWAERDHKQEYGLDKGKTSANNVIGTEGASLSSDEKITVYTAWYDEEGRPLPEGLGEDNGLQYGLTARLAKVTAENKLDAVSHSKLSEFGIKPGTHTEVLRVKDNLTTEDHFYVHVVGTSKHEKPSFDVNPGAPPPLDTRPKHATPFLVPFNDESEDWKSWSAWNQLKRAYDAEQLDSEPIKPRAAYSWYLRPEYQFSQLSLEVESIIREYTDESGNKNEQELLVEQEGEGRIPTIRSNDDLITVFYSLIANNLNRLTPLEGEQEWVFGLGASEVKATIGKNREIRFDNLSHIDYLDPTDLLSIRLYLNHDAANTLWEWVFTRNGLHVYYEVPGNTQEKSKRALPKISDVNCSATTCSDIEILSLLAPEDEGYQEVTPPMAAPETKVRTLGGMRLRFRYIPPNLDGLQVTKVTWNMGYKGRYCNRYGVDAVACVTKEANDTYEQTQPTVPPLPNETGDWSVYWEPVKDGQEEETDWSNWAGTQTTDTGVGSSLKAEYTIPVAGTGISGVVTPIRVTKYFDRTFTLSTRELKPATGTEEPMKGSDVAMLEAILWNIGMSPSTKPGIGGVRLSTDVARSEYKTSNPSVGQMVGRFNYISFGPIANPTQKMDMAKQNNNDPIAELGLHWRHYAQAHSYWRNATVLYSNLDAATITLAESVWDGVVNYPNGISFPNIDATYSAARHSNIQTLTGSSFSRSDILKAMAQMEVSSRQQRDYRTIVGGADERGSKGFNQLLNTYNYGASAEDGDKKAAREVTAYRADGSSAVNHYDARFNIIAKAAWMAVYDRRSIANGGSGGGSFYRAFAAAGSTSYQGTYTWPTANPLKRIKAGSVSNAVSGTNHSDDDYERLAKGLGGYNQGAGIFSGGANKSWINMLLDRHSPQSQDFINVKAIAYKDRSGDEKKLFANTESMRYAMSIMHDSDKLNLSYRTYVWKGGVEPDEIPVLGADGNPETDEHGAIRMQANPKAGQDWCFGYGEQEWMSGKQWSKVKSDASYFTNLGKPQNPVGRVNCN